MPRFQVAYRASDKDVVVQAYGDATVAGHANIGNFYHDGGGTDVVGGFKDSHVVYHHVQDALYKVGEQNMQAVEITYKRVTNLVSSAADVAMNLSTDTTEQITNVFTPADAPNRDVTYASSDPTKVTVSATGLITAVALGTAVITVTSKDSGVKSTITITVS